MIGASLLVAVTVSASGAEPPALVPRAVLFGNPVKRDATISPDGTRLAYLAPDAQGVLNIWVRTLGRSDDAPVSRDARRPVLIYRWAEDGTHLLYMQDSDGDENWHVYAVHPGTREVRDLTPFPGVKSQNLLTSPRKPGEILVGLNRRDRMVFDMYRVDLATGAATLEAQNPGDVIGWAADPDLVVRAATAFDPDSAATILRVRDTASAPWRELARWAFEDGTMFGQINGGSVVAGFSEDGGALAVVSAARSDTARVDRRAVGPRDGCPRRTSAVRRRRGRLRLPGPAAPGAETSGDAGGAGRRLRVPEAGMEGRGRGAWPRLRPAAPRAHGLRGRDQPRAGRQAVGRRRIRR
jgi:hypothetical protein